VERARLGDDDRLLTALCMGHTAKAHKAPVFSRRRSLPGGGKSLALVLLYDRHDLPRCPRGQACVSACRLVNWAQASAGTRDGTSGTKLGQASLKWACSEAAGAFLRNHPAGHKDLARLETQQGKGQALTILAPT
jgi:Transposase IS116/IS110/IS902 family